MAARHARTEGTERPFNAEPERAGAEATLKACGKAAPIGSRGFGNGALDLRSRCQHQRAQTRPACIHHFEEVPPHPGFPEIVDSKNFEIWLAM
jgi:hypothetical protein